MSRVDEWWRGFLRGYVYHKIAQKEYNRGSTRAEREWARLGWVPASLKIEEVRDDA